ncbi:MAG: YceI family protein, partial [Ginsengibacter sp.]
MKFVLSVFLLLSSTAFAQKYIPSDNGSKVHFVIRNFGIKTGGDLEGVKGEIFFTPAAMTENRFNVVVDPSTIDTDNETRDKNLRSEEYFDVV